MNNISKEELESIEKVVKSIPLNKFTFPGYTQEDIQQEARIICLEVLDKNTFKGESSVETYLMRSVFNALINLQRQSRLRTAIDCDCNTCPVCVRRNAKESINGMPSISNIKNEKLFSYDDPYNEYKEVMEKIDRKLPPELRPDYLRMRQGEKITEARKNNIIEIIKEIIDE